MIQRSRRLPESNTDRMEDFEMKNVAKYTKNFYAPITSSKKWIDKDCIEKAPIWCSVDLRDGNPD